MCINRVGCLVSNRGLSTFSACYPCHMETISQSTSLVTLLGLSFSILIATIGISSCSQGPPSSHQHTDTQDAVERTTESLENSEDMPINELSSVVRTQTAPGLPDAEVSSFSPTFGVQEAIHSEGSISIILCYDIPSSEKDWILGRLPGDVFLSDGSFQVDLLSFTLVSLDSQPGCISPRRCDRFEAIVPVGFNDTKARLTVKRIAASIPEEVDWYTVTQRVGEVEPNLVFEPMLDQGGPSFAVILTPPGMSDREAHDLILGMVDPVILGPWVIPVEFDS
jgi:hypothetical protein